MLKLRGYALAPEAAHILDGSQGHESHLGQRLRRDKSYRRNQVLTRFSSNQLRCNDT